MGRQFVDKSFRTVLCFPVFDWSIKSKLIT